MLYFHHLDHVMSKEARYSRAVQSSTQANHCHVSHSAPLSLAPTTRMRSFVLFARAFARVNAHVHTPVCTPMCASDKWMGGTDVEKAQAERMFQLVSARFEVSESTN